MSTTALASRSSEMTAIEASERPAGRVSSLLKRTGAVAAASISLLAMGAVPAEAAGSTTQPDIQACFDASGLPVYIMRWDNAGQAWNKTGRSATNGSDGCIRFNDIVPGYYYELVLYKTYNYGGCVHYVRGETKYVWAERGDALNVLSTRQNPTRVSGGVVAC